MRNVLITGGAGFVGSHLAERLLTEYDVNKVFIIDNLIRTNNLRNIQHLLDAHGDRIKFIHGDISTFDFESVLDPFYLDVVFHLAATRINRCNEYNLEGHVFNADGSIKLLNWISKYSTIKLFFASSASVYQSPKRFPILEMDACSPHTIYGSAKLYTENMIRSYNQLYGLDYTINRFFSVYGPRMDNTGAYTEVIFNWLNKIKHMNRGEPGNKLTVYGDPDQKILDLVFVDDVVDAILMSTLNSNKTTFNVSTETGVSLSRLIDMIQTITHTPLEIEIFADPRTDIEAKRIGSTDKLRQLGWTPKVSLEEGITRTWEWINTGIFNLCRNKT